VNEEMKT